MVTALEPQKPMAARRLLLGWSDQMGVMDIALISPDVSPDANVRDLKVCANIRTKSSQSDEGAYASSRRAVNWKRKKVTHGPCKI